MNTKEFFGKWKQGILAITPIQMIKINFIGIFFIIFGVLIGIYAAYKTKTYWLMTILVGSFILTSVSLIGNFQKYSVLKQINIQIKNNESLKGGENEFTEYKESSGV